MSSEKQLTGALWLLPGRFVRRFLSKIYFWQTAWLTKSAEDQCRRAELRMFTPTFAEVGDHGAIVHWDKFFCWARWLQFTSDTFCEGCRSSGWFFFRRKEAGLTSDLIHEQHDNSKAAYSGMWSNAIVAILFSTLLRAAFCCILRLRIWARFEPFCRKEKEKRMELFFFESRNSFMHSSEKRKKKGRKNNFVEPCRFVTAFMFFLTGALCLLPGRFVRRYFSK